MSFNNYDFPNASYYKNDLTRLINAYKELSEQYTIILADVKQLQEDYATIDDKIDSAVNEAIARAVADLEAQIAVINNRVAMLNSQMLMLDHNTNLRIDEVIRDYLKALNDVNLQLLSVIGANRLEMLEIAQRLQEEIDNINLDMPYIFNPVQGIDTSVERAVNDVYNALNFNAITADEYEELFITASAYDSLQLSALDYDTRARLILL